MASLGPNELNSLVAKIAQCSWERVNQNNSICDIQTVTIQDVTLVVIIGTINPSPPGQNGCHFAGNIFNCILMNKKFYISIQILLKFVPEGPIDNKSELVQVMAWHQASSPTETHMWH